MNLVTTKHWQLKGSLTFWFKYFLAFLFEEERKEMQVEGFLMVVPVL